VACSVTELTPVPRSWGRFYIPGPNMTMFDAFGRIANTAFFADPTRTLYDALYTAQLIPVVSSAKWGALFGVQGVQVDDIPDIQRKRRPKQTLARTRDILTP